MAYSEWKNAGKEVTVVATNKEIGSYYPSVTVNCTAITGYQNLTIDDFYLVIKTLQYISNPVGWSPNYTITKSYNATTGILTLSTTMAGQWGSHFTLDVVCFHY